MGIAVSDDLGIIAFPVGIVDLRHQTLDAIAQRLSISPKTVSNVQTQIRAKLGVTTAMELLNHARQHGLLLD